MLSLSGRLELGLVGRRRLIACAVLCLVAAVASAQSGVAGKWISDQQSSGGAMVLQLAVKDASLTGTITVGESPTQAISEGKVDARHVTFKTSMMMNGKETPVSWEGDVKEDQLTLVRSIGTSGRKMPAIVLKRSK